MTSVANTLVVLASDAATHESVGNTPYLIGGIALALLLALLLIVVFIGGGREHS